MNNGRRILIVDDDPVIRKRFEQVLAGKGYAVFAASSGEDALWQLGNDAYDAVFTDIPLRGMSGLDVAEEILALQPGLPVVIVTGDSSAAVRERATAACVAEFLCKPLSPEQLVDTADRVLSAAPVLPPQTSVSKAAPVRGMAKALMRLRSIILFLLAPFFALGYVLTFPLAALGALSSGTITAKNQESEGAEPMHPAIPGQSGVLKTMAKMVAGALIGVAYAVAGPIVGIGLVVCFSFQAWGKLGAKAMGISPDIS